MKILAVITARGGSKRLPGKNLALLGGRPLIVWSIDAAKGIAEVCDILVSTDDLAIADVARKAGALVPWLRPAELATDTATSENVCLHALDWYESKSGTVDGLLLLQPTSPFRSRQTVEQGIRLFQLHKRRSVISVSPAKSHPYWCVQIQDGRVRPFVNQVGLNLRSQELPPAYVLNGALYLASPEMLRAKRSFCDNDTVPLVIDDPEEGLDIDTEWDWRMAEAAVRTRLRGRLKEPRLESIPRIRERARVN